MLFLLIFAVGGAWTAVAATATPSPPPKFCTGCDLAGAQLAGADFTNAFYVGTNFANADLRNVTFRHARIVAANFKEADMTGAIFDAAQCMACNFEDAKLGGASFASVQFTATNFSGFQGELGAVALRDLLTGCFYCNFSGANFTGRDFSMLPLISIDFSRTDLTNANFDGAVLCSYSLKKTAWVMTCDSFAGANVKGASFTNVQVCEDPINRRGCVSLPAATLKTYAKSSLDGALF